MAKQSSKVCPFWHGSYLPQWAVVFDENLWWLPTMYNALVDFDCSLGISNEEGIQISLGYSPLRPPRALKRLTGLGGFLWLRIGTTQIFFVGNVGGGYPKAPKGIPKGARKLLNCSCDLGSHKTKHLKTWG